MVPPGHSAGDLASAVNQERGRHRDQAVGSRGLVRRRLRDDPPSPALPACHPDGHLERILEHCGAAEAGLLPVLAQRPELTHGPRGRRTLLVHEQQQCAAALGETLDRHRVRRQRADGQRRRLAARSVHDCAVFAQYASDAFDAARASALSKPGAIDAVVPAITSWCSISSSRSQLCWPMVRAMKQPSSTSSGSEKCRS